MDKIIIASAADGSVIIITPAKQMFDIESDTRQSLAAQGITFETDEDVLEWVAKKDVPEGFSYRFDDISQLPESRENRSAWKDDGVKIYS